MNEFLSVSKNLEIQQLSKDVEIDEADPSNQNQEYITEAENVDHNIITEEEEGTTIESKPTKEKEVISRKITSVGSKFQCPKCDKLISHMGSLTRHIQSVHEGVKYACNQCDHQATQQSNLARHIQSVHEGVK